MRGALFRNLSLCARRALLSPRVPCPSPATVPFPAAVVAAAPPRLRFFSSESDSSGDNANPASESSVVPESDKKDIVVEDVSNKELKTRLEQYFNQGNEEALPGVLEALMRRRLADKHEETDDELMDELQTQPFQKVDDEDFENDFEEAHSTDEELEDLYNAPEYVMQKMGKDEFFNMDDKKWDDMIREATEHGYLKDTKECEEILEDMLSWDKLLPDDLKKKVEDKFNELGDMCERGELEPEEAYERFKEFEDEMVLQYGEQMEAEGPPEFDNEAVPDNKKDQDDDPPGEGPILTWKSRIVFGPGGDAWHPKNRKVKMSVTVKEIGLSKHQSRRLRELVGKRYNPGKDELTITSERFEHREENRKDCLRTLYGLIEEAGKANKIAEDLRTSYVKQRLKANPAFMQKLQAKITRSKGSDAVSG